MTSSALTNTAIIGAGGHSRSVIGLLHELNFRVEAVYDDSYDQLKEERILTVPLCGNAEAAAASTVPLILAIGDNAARAAAFRHFGGKLFCDPVISKYALVRESAKLGKANLVFPFAFINSSCQIGDNNIINSKALLEHECVVGNHCHISVSAVIAGRVKIGSNCFVGAGAVIRDKISICDNVVIGAGAVVVKDVSEPGVYAGNPLRKLK